MQIQVWCKTDKGLRRESNQDSYLINKDLGLYVVADGMGGHSGGEVASAMATAAVFEYIQQNQSLETDTRALLTKAYEEASARIYDRAAREPRLMGMGTTMVLCYLKDDSAFICNVGDSRGYLYHKPFLWQITEDHSLMNEQLRAGIINEDQIKTFMSKNVITRSVGYERAVNVDIIERKIEPGDCILLCSDGFSGLVPDVMAQELLNRTKPEKVVDACVERALQNGGDDNVTVLYLEVLA